MRRVVVMYGLALAVLWGIAGEAGQAAAATRLADSQAGEQVRAIESPRAEECRFQWVDPGTWTPREERLTARCAVRRWSVPGGLTKLTQVISCESSWNRLAWNDGGPYVGLAQHALSAYESRIATYDPPAWDRPLSRRWANSRGQLVMTTRMVHAEGWGAWSCA